MAIVAIGHGLLKKFWPRVMDFVTSKKTDKIGKFIKCCREPPFLIRILNPWLYVFTGSNSDFENLKLNELTKLTIKLSVYFFTLKVCRLRLTLITHIRQFFLEIWYFSCIRQYQIVMTKAV